MDDHDDDLPPMLGPDVVHGQGGNRISAVDPAGRAALNRRARRAARKAAAGQGVGQDTADAIARAAVDAAINQLEQWEEWPGRAPWWRWLLGKRWSVYVQGRDPDDVIPLQLVRFYRRSAAQRWVRVHNAMLLETLPGGQPLIEHGEYAVRARWDPNDNL